MNVIELVSLRAIDAKAVHYNPEWGSFEADIDTGDTKMHVALWLGSGANFWEVVVDGYSLQLRGGVGKRAYALSAKGTAETWHEAEELEGDDSFAIVHEYAGKKLAVYNSKGVFSVVLDGALLFSVEWV